MNEIEEIKRTCEHILESEGESAVDVLDPDGYFDAVTCGNADDVFSIGVSTGKVQLARWILTALGNNS